jgi:hypothetical protein
VSLGGYGGFGGFGWDNRYQEYPVAYATTM